MVQSNANSPDVTSKSTLLPNQPQPCRSNITLAWLSTSGLSPHELCSRTPQLHLGTIKMSDHTRDSPLNHCILNLLFLSPIFGGIWECILIKQMCAPKTKEAKASHGRPSSTVLQLSSGIFPVGPACSRPCVSEKVVWGFPLGTALQRLPL